ncbi:MAG: membrane protein insertion efficiency factor YidD [Deltaproteobacteria bacterium]|nr:membrane protein insertion efficiency factor YidD [Deltaproteobacteria bacterium]
MISCFFLLLIVAYQRGISPLLAPSCRFYPCCSEYAATCLRKDSLVRALSKIVKRIVCCHPFHPGGVDLP